jgi:hypothetical protein
VFGVGTADAFVQPIADVGLPIAESAIRSLRSVLLHSSVLSATTIRALVLGRVARRRFRPATPFVSVSLLIRLERRVLALAAAAAIGRVNTLGGFSPRSGLLASIFVSHTCSHS